MDDQISDDDQKTADHLDAKKVRASDWLWRPTHAKIYWVAASAYWTGFLAAWLWSVSPEFFRGTLASYLGLVFHPVTGVVILGAGYVRALFATGDWEWVDPSEVVYPWPKSIGGTNDPYSDPADPRSPNWVGSSHVRARRYGED